MVCISRRFASKSLFGGCSQEAASFEACVRLEVDFELSIGEQAGVFVGQAGGGMAGRRSGGAENFFLSAAREV